MTHPKQPEEPPEYDRAWALYGCGNAAALQDPHLQQRLEKMLDESGFERFGSVSHKFGDEGGVTALSIIGASNAAIHTWPEHGTAIVGLFYCHDHGKHGGGNNDVKAEKFEELMLSLLCPTRAFRLQTRAIPVLVPASLPTGWVNIPTASNVEVLKPRRRRARI